MADLLSAAQHLKIRAALQDVVDTFADTDFVYHRVGVQVEDYMEDFESRENTSYTVKAIVAYLTDDSSELKTSDAGVLDKAEVKVTLGFDDLKAAGLIDSNNLPVFSTEDDHFLIRGVKYRFLLAAPEGAFEDANVLVTVYGFKDTKQA